MSDPVGTFTEWMVTGEPGDGFPSYRFVWREWNEPSAEQRARQFVANIQGHDHRWRDGPHLSVRSVTFGEWMSAPAVSEEER